MEIDINRKNGGFTLVELMIVIVILALLAGMIILGTRVAIKASKESAIRLQIEQLSMALDKYKNEIGEYPPDFTDPIAVMRHVKKRWPRSPYGTSYADWLTFCEQVRTVTKGNWDLSRYGGNGPTYALVFWLGGLPDETGKPSGFFLSPTDPLGIEPTTVDQREEPRFDFAPDTIVTKAYAPAFVPKKGDMPIVYFLANGDDENAYCYQFIDEDGENVVQTNIYYPKIAFLYEYSPTEVRIAVPYAKTIDDQDKTVWYEPNRFQLIHPGQDGIFTGWNPDREIIRVVDIKQGMTDEDDDNIVNFAEGATLDSEYKKSE